MEAFRGDFRCSERHVLSEPRWRREMPQLSHPSVQPDKAGAASKLRRRSKYELFSRGQADWTYAGSPRTSAPSALFVRQRSPVQRRAIFGFRHPTRDPALPWWCAAPPFGGKSVCVVLGWKAGRKLRVGESCRRATGSFSAGHSIGANTVNVALLAGPTPGSRTQYR